ncbi:hypothetical protein FQN50_009087 [Emmonsiellopsis sp. PD_5]|nr:hypothetical protein FQN50_009087 [Emmonsiellopsis sp. PD_5]
MEDVIPCPFCEFSDADSYFLTQHVELCHPENGVSPFIAADEPPPVSQQSNMSHIAVARIGDQHTSPAAASTDEEDLFDGYVECPQGCGEIIPAAEISNHLDLHVAEGMAFEEAGVASNPKPQNEEIDEDEYSDDIESKFSTKLPKALRNRDKVLQGKDSRKGANRDAKAASGTSHRKRKVKRKHRHDSAGWFARRLGKSELGPYAHEKQMPSWLWNMLEEGPKITVTNQIQPDGTLRRVESVANETPHLIPVLAQLCNLDDSVERAFLCSPSVRHVFKMQKEGGFCGYRNIQMLVSYIQDSRADGYEQFPGRLPSILRLQDMIEQAWDLGFNSAAKAETGGIKGTRKYIGTSEAQALFLSLGVRCNAGAFSTTADISAHEALLVEVMEYFREGDIGSNEKIIQTELPPIYFQHQGHSLTIVGFEIRKSGSVNLLVFDPMFKTAPAIERLLGNTVRSLDPARLLGAYRRGGGYLQKYKEFEILKLLPSAPGRTEAPSEIDIAIHTYSEIN